jgi:hypothetical protein
MLILTLSTVGAQIIQPTAQDRSKSAVPNPSGQFSPCSPLHLSSLFLETQVSNKKRKEEDSHNLDLK